MAGERPFWQRNMGLLTYEPVPAFDQLAAQLISANTDAAANSAFIFLA
jgi:hypothetical protein